VINLHIGASL